MMVASSFDLWQKDQFFQAAEEVQESADKMESAYRRWIRERREGLRPEELDELCSELQTALGTAKWQLEEFEKAVRLSYGHRSHHFQDNATARHRQFIEAIEDQISRVETSLKESFSEQGKQPFRWVNLDEEECDDLAAFLSGAPQCLNTAKDAPTELRPPVRGSTWEYNHKGKEVELDLNGACSRNTSNDMNCLKDVSVIDKVAEHIIEIEPEVSGTREDIIYQIDRKTGSRKTWGSPKFSGLRVDVTDEDLEKNKFLGSIEATPKEKGYKPAFWQLRCSENPQTKGAIALFSQFFDQVGGFQRQSHSPRHLQFGYSVRLALVLMITIFLMVPFVLYST